TTAGSFTFSVTATDTLGGSGSKSYTVTINPAVTVTTPSLPGGTQGSAYSQAISATGGTGSMAFTSTATPPTGPTLSSVGVLSGTPTTAGTFTFSVNATDSASPTPNTGSQSYTVTINPAVAITTPTLSDWTVNKSGYSQTLAASGGSGTYTFGATGSVP